MLSRWFVRWIKIWWFFSPFINPSTLTRSTATWWNRVLKTLIKSFSATRDHFWFWRGSSSATSDLWWACYWVPYISLIVLGSMINMHKGPIFADVFWGLQNITEDFLWHSVGLWLMQVPFQGHDSFILEPLCCGFVDEVEIHVLLQRSCPNLCFYLIEVVTPAPSCSLPTYFGFHKDVLSFSQDHMKCFENLLFHKTACSLISTCAPCTAFNSEWNSHPVKLCIL